MLLRLCIGMGWCSMVRMVAESSCCSSWRGRSYWRSELCGSSRVGLCSLSWSQYSSSRLNSCLAPRKSTQILNTYIDHPIGYLAHAQTRSLTQLLLLILTRIRMIRMPMQPIFQKIGHKFRQFSSLSLGPFSHRGSR